MNKGKIDPFAALKAMPQWGPKWMRFAVAFPAGCIVLQLGLSLLGVRLELFFGMQTFSLAWVFCMSLLPMIAGLAVGAIYGYGGKYLAHFPPILVMGFGYYQSMHHQLPQGAFLIPWQLWAFFVILHMEFCAFGGVFGELYIRRYIGWGDDLVEPQWADSVPIPSEEDSSSTPAASHSASK